MRGGSETKPSEAITAKQISPAPPVATSSSTSTAPPPSPSPSPAAPALASSTPTPVSAPAPSQEEVAPSPSPSPAPAPAPVPEAAPAPPRPANRDLFKGLFGDDAESDIFSDNKGKSGGAPGSNDFDDLLNSINENDSKLFK
jgi:hypothetical protein